MAQEDLNNNPEGEIQGAGKDQSTKMIISLTIVGVISAALLVYIFNYSTPKIKANIELEMQKSIRSIFPEAEIVKDIKNNEVFEVEKSGGDLLGYAFVAKAMGYQGEVKLISGADKNMAKLSGFAVLESNETPGLGAEITTPKFKDQFVGLDIEKPIELVKNEKPDKPYEVEAITGATITSTAVVVMLNEAVANVRDTIKKEVKQ